MGESADMAGGSEHHSPRSLSEGTDEQSDALLQGLYVVPIGRFEHDELSRPALPSVRSPVRHATGPDKPCGVRGRSLILGVSPNPDVL